MTIRKFAHLTVLAAVASTAVNTAIAYEIHGRSDTNFVLTCKDGWTNPSSMPPNHDTAVKLCADHGGVVGWNPVGDSKSR